MRRVDQLVKLCHFADGIVIKMKTFKQFFREGYGDEGEMDKLHPALKDLHSRLKSSEHHERYGTDYRAEAPYGKQKHHELSARHLGKWERAPDRQHGSEDFDEDDDHEVLNKKSGDGIHKIVSEIEKKHKVKIHHGASEKNWQSFAIKEK